MKMRRATALRRWEEMQRILIVSDHPGPLNALSQALVRAGFAVMAAAAEEGRMDHALASYPPDLCIVDAAHSRLNATRIRRHLGYAHNLTSLPLLILATEEDLDVIEQPPVADDFMLAPYRPEELLTRVRLLLWRAHRTNPSHLIVIGDLVVDQNTYQARVGGERLELTYKEYELLRFLASHRGTVFTREALLSHVWGYDYYGGVRTVDVHIRRVRAKLGEPAGSYIETVRNVGYRFADARDPGEE